MCSARAATSHVVLQHRPRTALPYGKRKVSGQLVLASVQTPAWRQMVAAKPQTGKPAEAITSGLVQAPSLATDARSRPSKLKSTEELEAEQMAAHPRFKARPLK